MLKSLLVVLDVTQASVSAAVLARELAVGSKALLQGLVIVDPWIVAPPEPTPMGAGAYKEHKDLTLMEHARHSGAALAQQFSDSCFAQGLNAAAHLVEGDVCESLIHASGPHDVIVLGCDASFGGKPTAPSPYISELLRDNPRPLIVTPENPNHGARTLVAYDGSIPSMRALQLFCALQLRCNEEAVVVSINPDNALATGLAEQGAAFMCARGYSARAKAIASAVDVSDALVSEVTGAGAGMVVAGAFGHRGFRQWLLGATTEELIAQCPAPLFIHH